VPIIELAIYVASRPRPQDEPRHGFGTVVRYGGVSRRCKNTGTHAGAAQRAYRRTRFYPIPVVSGIAYGTAFATGPKPKPVKSSAVAFADGY
jgi:hypothetical protein